MCLCRCYGQQIEIPLAHRLLESNHQHNQRIPTCSHEKPLLNIGFKTFNTDEVCRGRCNPLVNVAEIEPQ